MNRNLKAPQVFAWIFFVPGTVFILASIVRLHVDGLTVLGAVYLVLWAWLIGAFTRDFWVEDITDDHPEALGSLDRLQRDGHT